jgi:hypothetical protein
MKNSNSNTQVFFKAIIRIFPIIFLLFFLLSLLQLIIFVIFINNFVIILMGPCYFDYFNMTSE